jgi:carbamoyltransferase
MAHPGKRDLVPAVVHEDGTVRAQLVSRADNPLYYDLISEFEAISGVPLLLNTSFNDSEPIVCSPQDAIKTFMKTGIDHLALGAYLVSKPCPSPSP